MSFGRYRYFPNETMNMSGFGTVPTARGQSDGGNNDRNRGRQVFGGRGHVLGDH